MIAAAGLAGFHASGAPADPGAIILNQPDGSRFEALVRGDEFFAWYETVEGHPIEQDPATKAWVYRADPSARQARSLEEAVVGSASPPSTSWTPQEGEESLRIRRQAQESRRSILSGIEVKKKAEQRKRDAPPGPAVKKLLTVCVRFSDSPTAAALTPVGYFQQKIYGVSTDPFLPKSTVADYYLDVSGNQLLLTGEAVGWIDLPYTKAQYGGNTASGQTFDLAKLRMLIQNTVLQLSGQGFDYGPYDADNDGFLDMLAIVFEGQGEADGGGPDTIWPHQYSYEQIWPNFTDGEPLNTGSTNARGEDVFIDLYFTNSEMNRSSADAARLVRAPIGTFCHEFAHALGLPDLYDRTAPKSSGLGKWSLMAVGNYNQAEGQAGDCPAWLDPYCRLLMGWDREINVTSNTLRARIPEAKGPERVVHRLWAEGQFTPQYFLVETRKRTGFDRGLPGEGLLVYHISVNDNTAVSQNDVQWYLQPRPWTGLGHYLVALEQADGKFDLEQSLGSVVNQGDAADAFVTGSEFTDTTMPGSKAYPGWGQIGEGPSTHVALKNIDSSQPDASHADLFVFEDQIPPQAVITSPLDAGPVLAELTEATGTAFDNSGVAGIRAWLYEAGPGGRYHDWLAGTWRSDFAEETRKPIAPGTEWSLALPALADGTYRLTVVATDATGLESSLAVSQFTIDGSLLNPSLVIDSPSGETYAEPPLVQGTSATPGNTVLTSRRFALYSENAGRWYSWSAASFEASVFDFETHALSVAGSDTAWSFSLPAVLGNGRYQIHAQSLNDRDRGAPWVSKSFVVTRTPTASLDSIGHQALLQSMGSLSGTAMPQGGYLLTEIRITIHRNGKYWNGSEWVNESAYVTAPVSSSGGTWNYAGALPAEDGLYAVSVAAYDNQGAVSAPVAGGNNGQNNILFHLDGRPPTVIIDWPPAGHVLTESAVDAAEITGTATDGSGRPHVRMRLKRLADGLHASRYGWTATESTSWHQGAFPGGDGGSQVRWVMEAALPDSGPDATWCMTNGEYELTVEARDAVGNVTSETRGFHVQYEDPRLAGVMRTPRLPAQQPVGPGAAQIGASLLATLDSNGGDSPHEGHALLPILGGSFGVVASRVNQSLSFGYSSREPYLMRMGSAGLEWSRHLSGPVLDDSGLMNQRAGDPPVVSFGADGSAVSVSTLMRLNYGSSRYDLLRQCEVVRVTADGLQSWTRTVPPLQQTEWPRGASASSLEVEAARILPDGATLIVGTLHAHDVRYFYGQTNFRSHVIVMLLDAGGALRWTSRYGEESEDELLHENESHLFFEPDGFGHVFLGTRRSSVGGPRQLLRKIRLSDGATLSEHVSGACSSSEIWGALTVDAAGRPLIASAVRFDDHDARLSVKRLSANELITDWQAYGPAQGASYDPQRGIPSEIPLLRADVHGVTVVCNGPGGNGVVGDGDDRILVTRFDSSGGEHLWSREVDTPQAFGSPSGARADFAVSTSAGDVLVTGWFGTSSYPGIRGHAKVSGNGDLQFVKNLADEFDLSFGSFLALAPAADGNRLAALHLDAGGTRLQVSLLDNPANVVAPPVLSFGSAATVSVALGGTVTLEIVNAGSPASFQWHHDAGAGFEPVSGAISARFVLSGAASGDAGSYRVVAVNDAGEATSPPITLSVIDTTPVITSLLEVSAYDDEYFFYQITADGMPDSFTIGFDPDNPPLGLVTDENGGISGFPWSTGTFAITLTATNALGSDTRTLLLTVQSRPVISFGTALDAPGLSWTTAAAPDDWFVQDYYQVTGSHAAVAYAAPGSSAWIETRVNGPGVLSFWWSAYITPGLSDRLVLSLDGLEQGSIRMSAYAQQVIDIPAGPHVIRWSLESGFDGDYSTTGFLDAVSFVADPSAGADSFADWASFHGLSGAVASPEASAAGDGIPNLMKYAFNLDPAIALQGRSRFLSPGAGNAGLPDIRLADAGGPQRLRVEFVRRRRAAHLRYEVRFSDDASDAAAWRDPGAEPVVTTIDDQWERVVVDDTVTSATRPRRFARVGVIEDP